MSATKIITHWLPLLCFAGLLASACQKKDAAPAEATSAAPVAAPATPSAANAAETPQLTEADLAVPEDFEDDAEKEISVSNYKTELGAIEKELAAPE